MHRKMGRRRSLRRACLILISSLALVIHAGASQVNQQKPLTDSAPRQWLIEKLDGRWEVLRDGKWSPIATFAVLSRSDRVRCLDEKCMLWFSKTDGSLEPMSLQTLRGTKLTGEFKKGEFTVPAPSFSDSARVLRDLAPAVPEMGQIAGRPKASSLCSGSLQISSPSCGEVIDVQGFSVKWATEGLAGQTVTLFVGDVDASERRRWNGIAGADGSFSSESLSAYLASLQPTDRSVDVQIRLARTELFSGVRVVKLMSRTDSAALRRRLDDLQALPPLSRLVEELAVRVQSRMWSRVTTLSRDILRQAPMDTEIQRAAWFGLCAANDVEGMAQITRSRPARAEALTCAGVSVP